jgi:hypothetical protein
MTLRKLLIFAAPLALVACAQEAPVADDVAEEVAAEVMTTANGTAPGTYQVSNDDGPQGMSTLNADGTYQDMAADGSLVAEGTWAVVEGKTCFTPTTEGEEAMCWTESEPAEDGSFTATADSGDSVTVSPATADPEA